MTADEIEAWAQAEAERLLPCKCGEPNGTPCWSEDGCPGNFRAAVAAKLAEMRHTHAKQVVDRAKKALSE